MRWALVTAILLMGGALAVTVWSTHAGVAGASEALIRGQADLFQHDIRGRAVALGHAPTEADLAELLADHAPEGLRFLATLNGRDQILAAAGEATQSGAALTAALASQKGDTPMRVEGRVRVVFRGPARRRFALRHHLNPYRPSALMIEFEPLQAEALRAAAARTLGVGSVAAGMLLVLALGAVRWSWRRATVERERERERRLASLGQLSAVLAHEIRNPLASLKGNAQLLASSLPEGERPRAKADRVVEEAIRLEELTEDLLAFARTGELHRVALDPAALLRQSVAAEHAGAIEIDVTGAPSSWRLDPDRMRQALTNLLDNALVAGAPVTAAVTTDDGKLLFEVRDRGPGVAPEDRARIFEPFFTKRTRGTGLGLAVVKRVVELHQGTLTVDDAPGGGARFRLWLPKG